MNVAVIGSGGRESAIAWAVSRSPRCEKLYILPGNGGTSRYGRNVPAGTAQPFTDLEEFVELGSIDLVIVGPEQPLVNGITDALKKTKAAVFGPSCRASRLEGSKIYLKEFLARYHIPTAKFEVFDSSDKAFDFVKKSDRPFVVKTDGLAAGKGAIVCKTVEETYDGIKRLMVDREFGSAGDRIVLEDVLEGIETSVFIITDGHDFKWLASAQDHKRIYDNDEGPNTGGMGAYAPVPFIDDTMKDIITENIIRPTIAGMQKEGSPYLGFLYLGLMLTEHGPAVIEYNIRLGDPEAQVILPLLKTDFLDIISAATDGRLDRLIIEQYEGYCTGVVLASKGYPDSYLKGFEISGSLEDEKGVYVFHAGTRNNEDGKLVTDGGRVICVSALGQNLRDSIKKAYAKATEIDFQGVTYRKDIGMKGLRLIEQGKSYQV